MKNLENDEEWTRCCKSIMLRKIRQIWLLLRSPLSLSLFSRLQLELTRTRTRGTRTRRTRGILSTWMKNWNSNFDSVEEVWSPGARGPYLYSLFRWIWAVRSNRHWSCGFPWSIRSVEHDPWASPWLVQGGGWAPSKGGRAPSARPCHVSRLLPWLLDSSRWKIIARQVNIPM